MCGCVICVCVCVCVTMLSESYCRLDLYDSRASDDFNNCIVFVDNLNPKMISLRTRAVPPVARAALLSSLSHRAP